MNLRSRGPTNLIPRVDNIKAFERELARKKKEQEKQEDLHRLCLDMERHQDQQQGVYGADDHRQNVQGVHLGPDPEGLGQGAANLRPQHQQRQHRGIGTYDMPHIHGPRLGIQPPAIGNNNFEIKSSLIHMIENNKYNGLAMENPIDHLHKFDKYCDTTKTNGVSEDAFKLRLFPFSLDGRATQWEKAIQSDTITTWAACKEAFLNKFFSSARTAKIRGNISGFQQMNLESFGEAWERFKGYLTQCPHHGFIRANLLNTFYRGILPTYRSRLDTASNGYYLGRSEEDAWELVENMSQSDSIYNDEYDRNNRGGTREDASTRKELKALQDKIDVLLKESTTPAQVNYVGKQGQVLPPMMNEGDGLEVQEEVCYINANGSWYKKDTSFPYQPRDQGNYQYQGNNQYQQRDQGNYNNKPQYQNNFQNKPIYNNQQGGFQQKQSFQSGFNNKNNQSNQGQGSSSQPQHQDSNVESMLKQLLESNARIEKNRGDDLKSIHAKIDGSYNDLNNKFKNLEHQVVTLSSNIPRPMGSLPGKPEQNPKEYCNTILTIGAYGLEVIAHEKEVDEIEKLLYGSEVDSKVEVQIVEKVDHKIRDKVEIQAVENIMDKVVQPVDVMAKKLDNGKTVQRLQVDRQGDNLEFELSPYDKLPFPQRFLTKAQKKVISKFRKDISEVGVKLPEISNMKDAHVQMMFIKDILAHKEEVAELLDSSTSHLAPPIPPKTLPKIQDPGKFTLPCSLGTFTLDDALVDSGASVNVISLDMVKSLGIKNMETNTSSLMFGDSSSTTPVGLIKDFPLKLGACTIPIDLTVLDMMTKKRVPLILGTPFLATVGACIDFPNKRVVLHNVNKNVSYPIKSPLWNGYCGTITCEEDPNEVIKEGLVVSMEYGLDEESSHERCDEHLESDKEEEVSKATKATQEKKKKMKEPYPPPLDNVPYTLNLHPMKLKDRAIKYKIKCKGKSKPFSKAKTIITPQLQEDPIKPQKLLSQVLTITLEGGKDPPSN